MGSTLGSAGCAPYLSADSGQTIPGSSELNKSGTFVTGVAYWSRLGTTLGHFLSAVANPARSTTSPGFRRPEVARRVVGAGSDLLSIGEARHSLEDVYLELITEDVEARKQ